MKKKFIVANWKANKTEEEAVAWIESFYNSEDQIEDRDSKEIIICPPFSLLLQLRKYIDANGLSLSLGTQDISKFGAGAYTGEIPAEIIKKIISHSIIGHSERRKYFSEENQDILAKIKILLDNEITPILCLSDMNQLDFYISHDKTVVDRSSDIIFVYEPPSAISGGGSFHAESPQSVEENASEISRKIGKKVTTLYGGSVNPDNASTFFELANIDGGLIGQASLDASSFLEIIKKC